MKKVVLTPNPYRDRDFRYANQVKALLEEYGIEVLICLPFDVDKNFDAPDTLELSPEMDKALVGADMMICLGGDGTILHTSKAATKAGVPVLGINIGTLGFIAELEGSEMELLRKIAAGDYEIERRKMLDITVIREGSVVQREFCLNDAVITKGAVARVVRLSVMCDNVPALEFGGDGLIVATPTGSTAYSLSAGGPVVEPDARVILLTPICAHEIRSRCIVASDNRVITVRLDRSSKRNAFLSVDGGRAFRLGTGDIVKIRRSNFETKLVRVKDRSFYEIVATKFRNT